MKKLFFILPLFISSCNDVGLTTAQKNAKQYVKEQINASLLIDIDDVKSIEVGDADTVVSSVVLSLAELSVGNAREAYMLNKITYDSLQSVYAEFYQTLYDMEFALNVEVNDQVGKKHKNYLRSAYPVIVTMKSGDTREVSVVMDRDGITPNEFLHEIKEQLESAKLRSINY